MRSVKEGFSIFLQGTHPRLGHDSQVKMLGGMFPILKMIHGYTQFQPDVDKKIENVDGQIHQLLRLLIFWAFWILSVFAFRICRVRSLLMEIVDPSKQPLWTLGNCILDMERIKEPYWLAEFTLHRCLFPLCQWWRLCLWEEEWIFFQHPKSRRWCNWIISAEEAWDIVYNISGCSEMFVWRWHFTWSNTGSEGFSFHTHLQIISATIHVSIKSRISIKQINIFFQESIPLSRCKCNKWQFRFYSWNVTLKYLKKIKTASIVQCLLICRQQAAQPLNLT